MKRLGTTLSIRPLREAMEIAIARVPLHQKRVQPLHRKIGPYQKKLPGLGKVRGICTLGLDAESERLVFKGLDRLPSGRTTFVISHRLSTIRNADVILVLQDGQIAEKRSHEELLTLNGVYAGLYAAQTGGNLAWHAR